MSRENRLGESEIKALWERALTLFGQGRYGEARVCLESLEPSLPGNLQLWSNLGVVCRDSGDLAGAER
ncbi:MAG: hypothetical protein WDO73_08850 [Ignavibacteriota bacterium]